LNLPLDSEMRYESSKKSFAEWKRRALEYR